MPSDDPATRRPTRAPKAREPIFDAPPVVIALVAALLAIYAFESFASIATENDIYREFAFIPGRLTYAFWPHGLEELRDHANFDPEALRQARIVRLGPKIWTLLTYAFLHGSWTHVGLNSIWIVAFGPPVARRLGAVRFLAFFAATAIAGAVVHWAFNMTDFTPLIGASAADSGLMAAAARFIFEPGAPLGQPDGFSRSSPLTNYRAPAPPLRILLRQRNAVLFLIIWLATNFIFGPFAQPLGLSEAPVAWLAHIGGFSLAFFLFPLFDRAPAQKSATLPNDT
jgi:membrane associated rhomboid family serine protease